MWLPAAEHCRADYTEVWCSYPDLVSWPDRVRSLRETGIDLLELGLDNRARGAMEGFDSIFCWYGSTREEFRRAIDGLPVRFFAPLPDGSCHAVDFYMRQAGGGDGALPNIPVTASAPNFDFVAAHPFSGSARKNWSLQRFRELAGRLSFPVQFTAGPEESLEGAVRFDDLRDVASWIAGAKLYIGNDSGISHLAAAVGTPALVIFRNSDPQVWCPRGRAPVLAVSGGDEDGPEVAVVARYAERLIELDRHDTA